MIINTLQLKFKLTWPGTIRITIVFLLSIYIVLAGQTMKTVLLIKIPGFYLAIGFSFLLSLAIITLSTWINSRLNINYPWRVKPLKRLILQFMLCFGLMLLITYVIVRVYFWLLGGNFKESGYMKVEFLLVTWMYIALNLNLLIQEMWPYYFKSKQIDAYATSLNVYTLRLRLVLEIDQVACLQREGNLGYCWLKDGRKFNMDYKMHQLIKILDPDLFVQVSRSEIYPFSGIEGYDKIKRAIILKVPLDKEVSGIISETRLAKFLAALENYAKTPPGQ